MKIRLPAIVVATLLLIFQQLSSHAFGQGTAFTYQGQLQNNGNPANGGYDLQFTLYTTNIAGVVIAGPVTNFDVPVSNGLFTTTVDFGPGVFVGGSNWLDIAVETNGVGPFSELAPRQQLTPAPYAQFAESANAGQLSGTLNLSTPEIMSGDAVILDSTNLNFFVGPSAGNPAGDIGNLNTAAGNRALYSNTGGNYNTASGAGALYSNTNGGENTADGYEALYNNGSGSDNSASGLDALYSNTSGSGNTADGFESLYFNTIGSYNVAAGSWALFSNESGSNNTAVGISALFNDFGSENIALGHLAGSAYQQTESSNIDIGNVGVAGDNNIIRIGDSQTQAYIAGTIYGDGGGLTNLNAAQLSGTLNLSTPEITYGGVSLLYSDSNTNFYTGPSAGNPGGGSGYDNTAGGWQALAANTSGFQNSAFGLAALQDNTIGSQNTAVGCNSLYANTTGSNNIAIGYQAGSNLSAGGSSNIDIGSAGSSTDTNIIRIGASQTATYLAGTVYGVGVELTSDRNAKENFAPINPQTVLDKVAAMPVTEWNYKTSQNIEHIGPMAQDFHAAFGLNGSDDKHISVVDEGGVALAAIQGLNEKVETLEARNAELKQENDLLAKRLDELEKSVEALKR